MKPYDIILFDLGGVLIELVGIPEMLAWSKELTCEDTLWDKWQHSETVRLFESGKLPIDDFAHRMVNEFNLSTTEDEFLKRFEVWPKCLFEGVHDYLIALKKEYTLGCLSNTNALHWNRFTREFDLPQYFDYTFLSFRLGMMKPDDEIFQYTLEILPYSGERILYCDDLPLNVESARRVGFDAYHTKGFDEVKRVISDKVQFTQ